MNRKKRRYKRKNVPREMGLAFSILIIFLSLGASVALATGVTTFFLQKYHAFGLFNMGVETIVESFPYFFLVAAGLYCILYFIPLVLLKKGRLQSSYTALLSLTAGLLAGIVGIAAVNLFFSFDFIRAIRRGTFYFVPLTPDKVRFFCLNAGLLFLIPLLCFLFHFFLSNIYTWESNKFKQRLSRLCSPPLMTLFSIPLLIIPGLFLARSLASEKRTRPNVLLIVADTLRRDHMQCYGYERNTTPNLDRLAESSMVFEKAFSQAPLTVPSLASMLTGTYPSTHRVYSNVGTLGAESLSLAEVFKNEGYRTAAFVSNGVLLHRRNLQQGFDTFDNNFNHSELNRAIPERSARDTTEKAKAWLGKHRKDPFFLFVHYQDPHGPYLPPPKYKKAFTHDEGRKDSQETLPLLEKNKGPGGIPSYQVLGKNRDISHYTAQYDSEILYMDEWIGKLLEAMETMDLQKETIIIFTADHGESLGENDFFFQHGQSLSEELIRVPLLIRKEGMKPGKREEMVELVDLFPTLLDLAQIQRETFPVEGRSLLRLLQGPMEGVRREWDDFIVSENPGVARCIRTKEWKLILEPGGEDPERLYHIFGGFPQLEEMGKSLQNEEAAGLKNSLRKKFRGKKLAQPPSTAGPLPEEEKRRLKALGYME